MHSSLCISARMPINLEATGCLYIYNDALYVYLYAVEASRGQFFTIL